ncbi:MAG: sigma-70 family RNA polymerase sigma factor [Planctomycetes bacterium]|nr:sigma-70 family RNA polymerase sigma factor [Planctomycetota bacterium]
MIADAWNRWQGRLERYCAQLLSNRHDAEEVVQDVFARLVAAPDRYDLSREPEVLLFRMVRNQCIDRIRKPVPRNNVELETAAPEATDHRDLELALAALPEAERDTLLLTTVDQLGYREVAAILGCSLGTVAARRGAAILKLRERLSR